MGDERPGRRTAGDRLHHRRLDFQEAAPVEEFPDMRDDGRTQPEDSAGGLVHDQVHIALAIPRFLIGQPVKLLRQRAQGFGQKPQHIHLDRQFPGLGFKDGARRAENVAQIPVFEVLVQPLRQSIFLDEQLNVAGHVA